jgi:hypothetical protein
MIIGMGDYSEPGEHIHELLPPGPGNTYCNIVIHDHVTSIAADIFLDMIETSIFFPSLNTTEV